MGGPMARNLLRAGHRLIVFDVDPARVESLTPLGAEAAPSPGETVGGSEVVLTSLPSSDVFVQVAESELLPHARARQVFIDLGTTAPPQTRRLAAAFAAKGAALVDAPVSGGPHGAEHGTLHMFVGGEEAVVRRCRPILDVLGNPEKITHCGPSGAGQVVKGVNQLVMGLVAAAHLEALAFGVRAGVDASVVEAAVGGDEVWRELFAATARRVAAGEGHTIFVKFPELQHFLGEARERGFPLPLTQALHEFAEAGTRNWADNMGRPIPSFWHELATRGSEET